MSAEAMPEGLHDRIIKRDKACLACGAARNLEVHHLIPRSGCRKELRWDSINLATLCQKCHIKATDREEGFEYWNVSRFGEQRQNLQGFWKHYHEVAGKNGRGWSEEAIVASTKSLVTQSEKERVAFEAQQAFRAGVAAMERHFVSLAKLADQIYIQELYQPNYDSYYEFLDDVGMDRGRGYGLASLGKLMRVTGKELPDLSERQWVRSIVPEIEWEGDEVKNLPQIEALVDKAIHMSPQDFELEMREHRLAKKHPELQVDFPKEGVIVDDQGEAVGKISRTWWNTEFVYTTLAIPMEKAKIPFKAVIR